MERWDEELADLGGRVRHWPAGAVLFREGDGADQVLVLRSGRVKVTCSTMAGTEVLLWILGPGELLGELSALGERERPVSAAALEPVTVLSLPSLSFAACLRARPHVMSSLVRLLGRRLRETEEKLVEFHSVDTLGRVTRRLVELADRYGARCPAGLRITLPLSQEELAGWTGSSRIATAKALRVLRDHGWIETGRREIVIRNVDALRRRSGHRLPVRPPVFSDAG
ncbi:Crp/Fnr family transcriptional regulator [Microbispora sp. H10949]|uniref:Crp/Fnr family transcriptional regulator n=1 Tax=Microbispora sp. H10949 TaxID=2729111 RepID=UPI002873E272|nr:Crp/Fnr family transcriptional regulator [Microbispora sp. H10949]